MDISKFRKSLKQQDPPENTSKYLLSLWYDGKNNWDRAHQIAQDISDADGSWIHAYLHRKDGDQFNASYWYSRAGKEKPNIPLSEEWTDLVNYFLNME